MVHASISKRAATEVGGRHGTPVVLVVDANRMSDDGFVFCRSEDGVFLVERIPLEYVSRCVRQ